MVLDIKKLTVSICHQRDGASCFLYMIHHLRWFPSKVQTHSNYIDIPQTMFEGGGGTFVYRSHFVV